MNDYVGTAMGEFVTAPCPDPKQRYADRLRRGLTVLSGRELRRILRHPSDRFVAGEWGRAGWFQRGCLLTVAHGSDLFARLALAGLGPTWDVMAGFDGFCEMKGPVPASTIEAVKDMVRAELAARELVRAGGAMAVPSFQPAEIHEEEATHAAV